MTASEDLPRGCKEIRRVGAWALKNANNPRNVAKGDWRKMSRLRLTWLFLLEVRELLGALWVYSSLQARYDRTPWNEVIERKHLADRIAEARRNVQHEIGDCVAFLAFLGDRI